MKRLSSTMPFVRSQKYGRRGTPRSSKIFDGCADVNPKLNFTMPVFSGYSENHGTGSMLSGWLCV